MRATADLGLKCPKDVSIALTVTHWRPASALLTHTEHPVTEMTNDALRLPIDRIDRGTDVAPRNVVFQPALILGNSCAPAARTGAGVVVYIRFTDEDVISMSPVFRRTGVDAERSGGSSLTRAIASSCGVVRANFQSFESMA